jgi:hypothetical protein
MKFAESPLPLPTDSPRVSTLGDVGILFLDAKPTCDDGL